MKLDKLMNQATTAAKGAVLGGATGYALFNLYGLLTYRNPPSKYPAKGPSSLPANGLHSMTEAEIQQKYVDKFSEPRANRKV